MAECVRLSFVDIDLGWISHGETTKVDGVGDRVKSQSVLSNAPLSFSLPPPLPWDQGLRAVYGRSWR